MRTAENISQSIGGVSKGDMKGDDAHDDVGIDHDTDCVSIIHPQIRVYDKKAQV